MIHTTIYFLSLLWLLYEFIRFMNSLDSEAIGSFLFNLYEKWREGVRQSEEDEVVRMGGIVYTEHQRAKMNQEWQDFCENCSRKGV